MSAISTANLARNAVIQGKSAEIAKSKLKAEIRARLMNSKLRDSQTRQTIPDLVFDEGMEMIVEEMANFIHLRENPQCSCNWFMEVAA